MRGSENPNLMPKGAITVRMHSVGGWGAITTGKNLAVTLFELLGYDIKANPKYGSEKKGQPTTYYLSAAPEPIRVNCEYVYVDVVLSPDPNVFGHSNPLSGLKKGGVFIIQSNLGDAERSGRASRSGRRQHIVDNDIRVFYLDAFQIAREEAEQRRPAAAHAGHRLPGRVLRRLAGDARNAGLTEETLFKRDREAAAAPSSAARARAWSRTTSRVVRRGFDEVHEITDKPVGAVRSATGRKRRRRCRSCSSACPPVRRPQSRDIHRFWEQTGSFYATGQGNDNLVDPFIGLSLMPAATGVFRDMTRHPLRASGMDRRELHRLRQLLHRVPGLARFPGLVSTRSATCFDTAVSRIETGGHADALPAPRGAHRREEAARR
ncbi:MAG: 2-oxoacid:acceptor oxidoreductase family protein [Chromatiales bacterium]|nr:2-oxoacid:acceptor oxidoreductase family protein [Chromatiales bacterium]